MYKKTHINTKTGRIFFFFLQTFEWCKPVTFNFGIILINVIFDIYEDYVITAPNGRALEEVTRQLTELSKNPGLRGTAGLLISI